MTNDFFTYADFTLDLSKSVVIVRTRRPLKLHVPNIVACFDDNPSVQMNLKSGNVRKVR